jgi:ketosteroid isomerase-like protein
MKSKANTISASLIILWLFSLALSVQAESKAKTRKVTKPPTKINSTRSLASVDKDRKAVAELDTQYQRAVKMNDAVTMERILAEDFVLVTGRGKIYTKTDLLKDAREGKTIYEQQDEIEQTVRVWDDTAVVTALLWLKGRSDGKQFEYKLWFSDTYVRTKKGWQYVFGQSSIPLPQNQ